MSIPIGAGVRERFSSPSRCGRAVRGPRKASRGMVWVQWDNMDKPVLWPRYSVIYVARHYETMIQWNRLVAEGATKAASA